MYVSQEHLRHLSDLARLDLQNLRDSYFHWLLIATWTVLIGCAMEGPEITLDLKEGFDRWRGGLIPGAHHPLWVLILSSVGWLLILGGIVGEGIFEALVSSADGSLQTFNDELLASASDRASNAEVIAKAFESRIAASNATAKQAGAQAAESNKVSAKLTQENLVLQMNVLKLRAQIEPRRLTGTQKEQFRNKLGGHPFGLYIVSNPFDKEAMDFAGDFASAFDAAKWKNIRID